MHKEVIMPAQNGTGPQGNGPKSGRGMGRCGAGAGRNNVGESTTLARGVGSGCRRQGGNGLRRGINNGGAGRGRQGNR